jgi:hypothetical protein
MEIAAGVSHVQFQYARAIEKVFCIEKADPTNRIELEKVDLDTVRAALVDSSEETGQPSSYSPAIIKLQPKGVTITGFGLPTTYLYTVSNNQQYNGIVFSPVSDTAYILEVHGLFYTPELSADIDESYWSYTYPEILVMASQCMLELFSRNTEGVKDWMNSIKILLGDIDKDLVEEEIANLGRW